MTTQTSIAKQEGGTASPEFADAYIALQAATARQPAFVTGDVEATLGRPATPFAHRVDAHRDLFNSN